MKTIKFAMVVLSILLYTACGPKPKNTATTIPVDSTNLYGTAPVQYGADDPSKPPPTINGGANDTGKKANTMNHEDSVREGILLK